MAFTTTIEGTEPSKRFEPLLYTTASSALTCLYFLLVHVICMRFIWLRAPLLQSLTLNLISAGFKTDPKLSRNYCFQMSVHCKMPCQDNAYKNLTHTTWIQFHPEIHEWLVRTSSPTQTHAQVFVELKNPTSSDISVTNSSYLARLPKVSYQTFIKYF